MNLECAKNGNNSYFISSFGSSMMFGFMLGSIFLTNLSDVYGRKPVLYASTAVSSVLVLPLIFGQSNYWITLIATILFGMVGATRYAVSYIYI